MSLRSWIARRFSAAMFTQGFSASEAKPPLLLARRHGGFPCGLFSAMVHTIFDLCAFFVIVPGSDQQKRHRVARIIVLLKHAERIFERFSAATIHAPVEAPGGFAVIKARPDGANQNLAREFIAHLAIETV